MENRRRIGNDYTFTWPFEVRVDEQTTEPYDLTGRVFRLYMVGQLETIEIPADEIEVDGNEITWTWHGKDQRYPGLYNAKLVENGGEDGMITVDVKYAVTLVPHTWQEGGSDDGCISLESVELVATEVSMTPGPRGPQGEQGPAGPQGETGPAGPQGAPGTAGPQGPEGKSAYEVAVDNGFEGTEEEWLESLHGGPRGPQGYSAYEVAVNEGYEGTESEWLASLKGETGATGATGPQGPQGVQGATGPQGPTGATGAQGQQGETGPQGPQGETGATGAQGPEGKSAYQVAVDNGYSGTEAQWLASLKGETGATGPQGPKGDTGETGATGPQGETGATGSQGPKGDTGDPGITSAEATVDGNTGTPAVQASIVNKKLTLAFSNLKGETGATGAQGPTGPAGPSGTLNTDNATAQAVNSSEALSGNVNLHKIAKTGSYNDLLDKPSGGGTEHNLRVSPNSVFDMGQRHIDLLPHSSRIFSWSQLKNVTAIHRGIYNVRKGYGNSLNLNGSDPTLFGIYKSNNTYLRVFPYAGAQIKCELVLNGTTSQSEVIISNQTTVFNTYNDYAIDFDKDQSLIRLYTYDPTNSIVTKVGELDVSTWNLSNFDEVYFATNTQNGAFYKACVTVMVNSPRTFSDYLGAPMELGRYNAPVGTEYSEDLYLAGTGLTLNGTITQVISDTDKVTTFSNSSIGYFEVGPSNLGNDWQYMWYHIKMRFTSVGTGMYIQPGITYWDKIIVESSTLPVITFVDGSEHWTPEVNTDYDVYVKFAEKPHANTAFYNQMYQVKTALRIYGDATVEVSEPYCFNPQVQNLCAETYNGSGFEGAIPFDGKSGFVPVEFDFNYAYANTRIPIGGIYIDKTNHIIYMWEGSTWKRINNA